MSRLKIPRPSKWVLIRAVRTEALFVVERKWLREIQISGAHKNAEIVAGSDDRDELVRFQKLTKES